MNSRQAPPARQDTATASPARTTSAAGVTPVWQSQTLLAGHSEAEIRHAGAVYRLRLTTQGKLLLTK